MHSLTIREKSKFVLFGFVGFCCLVELKLIVKFEWNSYYLPKFNDLFEYTHQRTNPSIQHKFLKIVKIVKIVKIRNLIENYENQIKSKIVKM